MILVVYNARSMEIIYVYARNNHYKDQQLGRIFITNLTG